jgi:hypothetical protein
VVVIGWADLFLGGLIDLHFVESDSAGIVRRCRGVGDEITRVTRGSLNPDPPCLSASVREKFIDP